VCLGDDLGTSSPERDQARMIECETIETETPPHTHDFYEICLVRSGEAVLVSDNDYRNLRRGSVVVVCPGAVHGYTKQQGFDYTDIYLQPDWLLADLSTLWADKGLVRFLMATALFRTDFLGGLAVFDLTESEITACERESADMSKEARSKQPSITLFNGCFLKTLWHLNRGFCRSHGDAFDMALVPEVWEGVRLIEDCILSNRALDVGAVARATHLSLARFRECFHDCTGRSPSDYYQERRVRMAAQWLTTRNMTLAEIAHQFGYTDSSHFGRFFRRVMGMAPGEYRKRNTRPNGNLK